MTSRDLRAMAEASDDFLLTRHKREAMSGLDRAEKAAMRVGPKAPKPARQRVARELLDALSVAEEWGALGKEC